MIAGGIGSILFGPSETIDSVVHVNPLKGFFVNTLGLSEDTYYAFGLLSAGISSAGLTAFASLIDGSSTKTAPRRTKNSGSDVKKQLLNGEEWDNYFKETYGAENVNWATKNKVSFGSRDLLEGHFSKHGNEFGGIYNTAGEYLQGAKDVMNNGYKVQYDYKVANKWGVKVPEQRTGYVRFMGSNSKGKAKFEFVGTNSRGDITTYHNKSGKDFWKTLNGFSTDKTINPIK